MGVIELCGLLCSSGQAKLFRGFPKSRENPDAQSTCHITAYVTFAAIPLVKENLIAMLRSKG
jgi:hypothetical protein